MAKANKVYWQDRFQAVEEMNNKTARNAVQAVTPAFDQAQAQIEKEINAWYSRFAKNNQISLQDAKKLLTSRELKEFRWDVEEYIKYGRQNALDQKWMKELENASARFHISRLEALKIRTQNAAERAFGNELDQIDEMAARIYMDGYYHTAYEIQRGLGIGWDVSKIDQTKLDKLLAKPWTTDKMTFSDRIWKAKQQLVDSVHTELTQMCILGKAPDQTIDNLAKCMGVSKHQAGRLIMTESTYFGSVAQKDCFNDLDVEKYEIVATLDSHTSEICQQMDGQVFDMKDFQAGVTAPPFHVWCRSCTVPWFEDNDDGTRAARGEDGKTYQVPANMKYQDWKDYFVDKTKDPADWLKPVVNIEDLKKLLAGKEDELRDLHSKYLDVQFEQGEFSGGMNDPFWKSYHSMSDDEYQKYIDDLKKQEQKLRAEYKELEVEYNKYYDRPKRGTPEREEWDKWLEGIKAKYGVDTGGSLFDIMNDIYDKESDIRDKIRDAEKFSKWKSKFAGKTEQYFIDELDRLVNAQTKVQDEIENLKKQIEDALKLQANAAYNAKTLREIKDEIIKKHESILKMDAQKQEFADIVDKMTKEQANLYEKMGLNFADNNYHRSGKRAYYMPSSKRVEMNLDNNNWEREVKRSDHAAWKTKFHEELHQLDHVLANGRSEFSLLNDGSGKYDYWAFTSTKTVTGEKMIQAIDDDVLDAINHAVDWKNTTQSTNIKPLKNLNRISSDAKDAFIEWLKTDYPSGKDRALISVFTDAVGMTTKGNLHPWKYGFWGHDGAYCKSNGKDGATSEVWAELCSGLLRHDEEMIDAFTKLMPNTVKVYSDTLDEVMEWAKSGSCEYKIRKKGITP